MWQTASPAGPPPGRLATTAARRPARRTPGAAQRRLQGHPLTDRPRWPYPSQLDRAARGIGFVLTPTHRQQVAQAQMRRVLLHTRAGTVAASAFALLLALYLIRQPSGSISSGALQGWLVLKLLVAVARIGMGLVCARLAVASTASAGWQHATLALLLLDGAVWGLAGWCLVGQSVPLAALGMAALDGVACVATFGLQVRLAATAAYALPILLPMALGLLLRNDELAYFASAGQVLLALLVLRTARVSSDQMLLATLLQLQAEQLMAQKDAALALAREHIAERNRFLAKVSHELRTPLHGMLGLARLLQSSSADPLAQRCLGLINASGKQLLELINDLLDVSRINAGHFVLHRRPFDLNAQLAQVADLFQLRAADKGLAFSLVNHLPQRCWVDGDAARLQQVFNNLLGNAVKFTRHGRIVLDVGPGEWPDQVRLTVQDSGDGISDADQLRIFAPFQQASTDQPTDGVGLGLTIAREIAIAMGGDISVHSQAGQGASFTVLVRLPVALPPPGLPAALPATGQADPPLPQPAPLPGPGDLPRLVLVAEDDETNMLIALGFLQRLGVRCESVPDGRQALLRALQTTDRPDLVLMDCRMPVLDGLAATREIRRQEQALGLPRLPIIALTATATSADRTACLLAGMDAVITKPFTLEELALALRGMGQAASAAAGAGADDAAAAAAADAAADADAAPAAGPLA